MTTTRREFELYPAIDIRGGHAVRLFKGDYNQEVVFGNPLEMALKWQEQGAQCLHLVDLDGAKAGKPIHMLEIIKIAKAVQIPVQVGGGIRQLNQLEHYLHNGVERIILGSAALKNPDFVSTALQMYGSQIAIGLDARDGYVATEGWIESSQIKVEVLAKTLVELGAETFIYTDISKDGTLAGPNVESTLQLAQFIGKQVIASGGISSLADVRELVQFAEQGIHGAIIGKALYQERFSLTEALQMVRRE